jgi:WhiB family redox-sensing transcriptional regulator
MTADTYDCRGCGDTRVFHRAAGQAPPEYCRDCLPKYKTAAPRIPHLTPQAFANQALCAEADPDLFVPIGQGVSVRKAKAICNRCPVIAECLAWALENPDTNAIYGGLTYRERVKLQRQQVAA